MTAGLENRPLTAGRDGRHGAPAGRSARRRRLGALLRPVHRARQLRRRRRDPRPRARVLRRHGAAYSTHVRDEANRASRPCARRSRSPRPPACTCRSRTSSSPASDNWGGAARLLGEIAAARQRGLPVDCDAYPYDTATNPLRNLLPRWVMENGIPAMLERLRRPRRAHAPARRDRAARAHQLRAHPVLGRRAGGHLAPPAGERRPHAGRHRAQPRRRPDRRRRRLHRGRSGRDAHPHHVDGGRRRARDHARAVGHRRLGRQRAGDLGRHQPGQAPSALLRHPRAHARSTTSATCGC